MVGKLYFFFFTVCLRKKIIINLEYCPLNIWGKSLLGKIKARKNVSDLKYREPAP